MRRLSVYIEIKGTQVYVGEICGNTPEDAVFSYAKEYMEKPVAVPISLSLPFSDSAFSPVRTKNFFEGLLPEGFTRRCVAEWMHVNEDDYLSILAGLGCECLGAVKIIEGENPPILPDYRKLTSEDVRNLAKEGATESAQLVMKSHLSLTGASGKAGLYYDEKENQWYLPIGDAPSTHIVKQSHIRLEGIVTNEQLCLLTASYLGIDTPDSFVVDTGETGDGDVLFATKRYDRIMSAEPKLINQLPVPSRLQQEDFAQAVGISSFHKYEHNQEGYLKKMFSLLRTFSSDPLTDQLKLWDICVFNYLIGNTDNHIKNLSLLYSQDLKGVRLAPAYDVVSTAIYESSTKEMALSIGGMYLLDRIERRHFEKEAQNAGLGVKLAMKRFDDMASRFDKALSRAAAFLTEQGFANAEEIQKRILQKRGIHYLRSETG